MSEVNQGGSPAPTDQKPTDSGNQNTNSNNVQLQYDDLKSKYDKLMEENKRYRQDKVTAEQKALEEQGKYKELFETTQKDRDSLREDLEKTKATYGHNVVSAQIKLEAQKAGCKDIDMLMAFYRKEIRTVKMSDSFEVDAKDVAGFLEKAKKEKPLLFEKEPPTFKDGIPNGGASKVKAGSYEGKSAKEIEALIRSGQ